MKFFLINLTILFAITMTMAQQPVIRYTLGMPEPQTHLYEVRMEISNFSHEQSLDVILPVWRPGRYLVLDFAGGVQEFSAFGGGKSLLWEKADKTTWRITTKGATSIEVRYKVYANEFNQRTRGLNDLHGFVDGAAVFMYVEKFRKFPITLEVVPYNDWHVTTGLELKEKNIFTAPDYDYLIDCPLEIGNQKDFSFDVDGVPHVLSIFGEGNWTADTLIRDISKIVKAEKDFWGFFPYKRYVFLLECTPTSGGGTEHINSAAIGTSPFVFKNPESYRGFLGLISHEFFHTWNVKQLRPKGIHPYDYTKENYSEELWVAEGTTSYFDELILVRAGFETPAAYLDHLAAAIGNERSRPGNKVQSLAEASYDAWIKYWKGTQQAYNSEADYYERGAMLSGLLDLEIRQQSGNKVSLDDVMREMMKRFPLSGPGYTLADFQRVVTETAGFDCKPFFRDFVYGTKPFEWEKACSYAGLDVTVKDSVPKAWLGIGTSDGSNGLRITRITAGSPAYYSGLDIGDEILALNGFRVRSSTLGDRIGEMKPGDTVQLTAFQNDQLRTFTIKLGTAPKSNYVVTQTKSPTDLQKSIYESWLGTKWKAEEKK
ncbi:MAG: M61 family metallopeptidase [Bacteroidota bacterium]